ncbi:HNH endonuclease [Pseudoalteromonas sp. SR43-5]|uniref:HNH endonuclease n=1 Tax=Pseudoalteromonas sp. SR43-5 TaxID=2760941 RepID=UPI0015F7B425|nr:HNH endonuclease [Pseudoalteromonas sp. SR43-5]MBB1306723.1 HNH endonuclease [Pseudoalteromonas sp. SR43-5]
MESIKLKESVLTAIQEYDELGRGDFLVKHKLKNSSPNKFDYFISFEGKSYECKPIFQAAYFYEFAERISGTGGVARRIKPNLENIGFKVIKGNTLNKTERVNFYWVNIGTSFKEVAEFKFLWAPKNTVNQNGQSIIDAGWKAVPNVQKGDILFCNYKGSLIHIAVASKGAYESDRPENRNFDQWKKDGYKIDIDLHTLAYPIPNSDFKDEFIPMFNDKCAPKLFAQNKSVSQKYMVKLPSAAGVFLLGLVGDDALNIQYSIASNSDRDSNQTVPEGYNKEVAAKARVGQGKFRQNVMALWNDTCAVTGLDIKMLLTASHILPWQLSNPHQKVDKFNGLALSPNIDKLFDKGFISFDEKGDILIKNSLSADALKAVGVDKHMAIKNLTKEHLAYLKEHREIFEFNQNDNV